MRNFLGINWHVRFNNPVAIIQLIVGAFMPILVYLGIDWHSLTTWGAVGEALLKFIGNPIAVIGVLVSLYMSAVDGTSAGLSDSLMAQEYKKPNKE